MISLNGIPQHLLCFLGETSGTTATFVIVDGWTVTVASVGDSRCVLDTQGGAVANLTVDHRLEDNIEECVHDQAFIISPAFFVRFLGITSESLL